MYITKNTSICMAPHFDIYDTLYELRGDKFYSDDAIDIKIKGL